MSDRRGTYFAFQGLLMAVLLLLVLKQQSGADHWLFRFYFLTITMGLSLIFIQWAPLETLSRWWVQIGLFLADAGLATATLIWTQAQSDLYLLYSLIIFGTALTRSLKYSFIVALITTLLLLGSAWHPTRGFPYNSQFWLGLLFLWIASALLAILSRDSQQSQSDRERRYQGRLIEVERLAALGQMAGEVAHRIKGPLTTILVNAEVLSHRLKDSHSALKELDQIQGEVRHCREILKNLLDLGRIEEMDFKAVDFRDPIRSAAKSLEPQIKQLGIELQAKGLRRPLPALGDQSLLHEAVAALLQNAIEATSPGGKIALSVSLNRGRAWWFGAQPAPFYALTIDDSGKGIDPKNLERIFEPFFTTKGKEGSGLGLSAALRIAQKHQGTIEAVSAGPGRGARFTLIIPKPPRRKRG